MKKIIFTLSLIFIIFSLKPCYGQLGGDDESATQGSAAQTIYLTNPLTGKDSSQGAASITPINTMIGQAINYTLGIVGSIAMVMFIYGGFLWMLSAGNNEQVQKGKNVLTWAAVGMIIIFSSYMLVKFVLTSLQSTA